MADFLTNNANNPVFNLLDKWSKANEEIFQTILNRNTSISKTKIQEKPIGENSPLSNMKKEIYTFPLTISSGILGNLYLAFRKEDLARILDLIIGGDGTSPMMEFDELHLNVLEESINQLVGTLESILSESLIRKINVRLGKPDINLKKMFINWDMLFSKYLIKIEGINEINNEILVPKDFSLELIRQLEETAKQKNTEEEMMVISPNRNETILNPQGGSNMYNKAVFPQLKSEEEISEEFKMDLIMDIPLELTVILGKTKINIKELVALGPGSVIELEKLAGEPVELMVNNRLVGYGEVIVIEENFGIRVIDVIENKNSPKYDGGKR